METTTFQGVVRNGVIVIADGASPLPEGSKVQVIVQRSVAEETSADEDGFDLLLRIAAMAGPTGIPDLATNIDHYLYGHPKVDDNVK